MLKNVLVAVLLLISRTLYQLKYINNYGYIHWTLLLENVLVAVLLLISNNIISVTVFSLDVHFLRIS